MTETELPEDSPLHGKEHLLDTHEGHLTAYSEVLDEADSDNINGVMLVVDGADGIDTLPTVAPNEDSTMVSLVMLAAHINHVMESVNQSGNGPVDAYDVAMNAVQMAEQLAKHSVEANYEL